MIEKLQQKGLFSGVLTTSDKTDVCVWTHHSRRPGWGFWVRRRRTSWSPPSESRLGLMKAPKRCGGFWVKSEPAARWMPRSDRIHSAATGSSVWINRSPFTTKHTQTKPLTMWCTEFRACNSEPLLQSSCFCSACKPLRPSGGKANQFTILQSAPFSCPVNTKPLRWKKERNKKKSGEKCHASKL